ncbi:Uncharacterized conserved protein, Alpha-E superfamily [Hydrobacter penzbergensis]|jgi:uncharacterized alpha-E superfamily protein|uniref:Uncharacterized conserved protein, Alpha-E superfamily n=1 Tax=Hydrobacter penzbergensis TaxID=1235997 RepID=A0A8X8ID36_9BACT|nr:alpha-E domain-containing protein [Hydrobacter penzbergensis]MBN8720769.1 alpha-E domain-containing protein [Sediminibacterium magnilacihabitans]PQV59368.1 putative alpha-E superfamily protein [Sediminibacterium magnilacihabitans]SDX04699.1 Uncharacterized conserved protein, Alpha-E superfamily [Hydrobacter penzbergensis]
MLSRIADSLFWLNRYMERAQGVLRVSYVRYILSLDKNIHHNLTWRPVLEIFAHLDEDEILHLENDAALALPKLITQTENANSVKNMVLHARENARGVQDYITKEVWEDVNGLYHMVNQPDLPERLAELNALQTLEMLSGKCVAYAGITDITMPRGQGWNFMNLGKYIERSLETIALTEKEYEHIGYNLAQERDVMQWRSLLLSLSGYELHLKNYRKGNINLNVLHQVIFNVDFPRSILYSFKRIRRYLNDIVKDNPSDETMLLVNSFCRLHSRIRYMDPEDIEKVDLKTFLMELRIELLKFSTQFGQLFFSYH